MKELIAGKTGPLKVSSAKAVRQLLHDRVAADIVERPDVESTSVGADKVPVNLHAPTVAEFLVERKKRLSSR